MKLLREELDSISLIFIMTIFIDNLIIRDKKISYEINL